MRTIFYDLETTGLGFHNKHRDIEIVEIGAVDEETRETFRQYLVPPGGHIPRDASSVHGIYLEDGVLVRQGEVLESADCRTGLNNFLSWLRSFKQPITLAGYNSHNYDDWVITHNLLREDLCIKEQGAVVEFLDVSKVVRPYLRSKLGLKKWSLTFAVKTCLGRQQDDAHDAVSDSIDTLDLRVYLKNEEIPSKAVRDTSYVVTMCQRISLGLSVEDPVYFEDQKKKKENRIKNAAVDKNQPLMRAFFKVIPKESKIEIENAPSLECKNSSKADSVIDNSENCESHVITKKQARKRRRERAFLEDNSENGGENCFIPKKKVRKRRRERAVQEDNSENVGENCFTPKKKPRKRRRERVVLEEVPENSSEKDISQMRVRRSKRICIADVSINF